MEGCSKVVTLPGDQLFQAAHLPNPLKEMRAPILHSYGPNKETAPNTLALLAQEGWETLLPTLYGAQNKPATWHNGTWTPVGGIAIKGAAAPAPISQDLRAALSLLWHRIARPGPPPPWMVDTFDGPLLPHEEAPVYHSRPSNTNAIDLEKALQDIQVRVGNMTTPFSTDSWLGKLFPMLCYNDPLRLMPKPFCQYPHALGD